MLRVAGTIPELHALFIKDFLPKPPWDTTLSQILLSLVGQTRLLAVYVHP